MRARLIATHTDRASTLTAGALGAAVGGGVAGGIATGAIAGAAGSVASQAVGLATGIQDRFSFKSVALSALAGSVSGGLGRVPGLSGSGVRAGAARSTLGNALTQGVAVVTGLQSKFDFASVASSAIGGAAGGVVGRGALGLRAGSFGLRVASESASGLASAATRSLINGDSFGDNLVAVLPQVIGDTVGATIAATLDRGSPLERALIAEAERSARNPAIGNLQVDFNDPRFALSGLPKPLDFELDSRVLSELAANGVDEGAVLRRVVSAAEYRGIATDAATAASGGSAADTPRGVVTLNSTGGPLGRGERPFSPVDDFTAATRSYGSLLGYYERGAGATANFVVLRPGQDDLAEFDRQVGFGLLGIGLAGAGSGVVAGTLGLTSLTGLNLFAATTVAESAVASVSGVPWRIATGERNTISTFSRDFGTTLVLGGAAGVAGAGFSRAVNTLGLRRAAESELIGPLSRADVRAKISGTAQQTGNDGAHAFRSYREAILLARNPEVKAVYLNRGYNAGLELTPGRSVPTVDPTFWRAILMVAWNELRCFPERM